MKQSKSRSNVLELAGVKLQVSARGAAEEVLIDFVASNVESSSNAQRVREYVQGALQSRAKGAQSAAYNNFVKEVQALRRKLEAGPDDAAEFSLVCLIQAIKYCVSFLKEGKHDAVLTTVLSIGLWDSTQAVRQAVLDLVVEMVVASAAFIPHCMQVMIFNLLPPPGSPPLAPDTPGESWVVPPAAVPVQADVMRAMEKGRVGPALREGLLAGIVEHLLSIDADIKWEEIVDQPTGYDHEEGESEDEQDDIFELDGISELDINELGHQHHALRHPVTAAAPAGDRGQKRRPAIDETADKLDSLMEMTFEHLQWRVNAGQLGSAWQTMLLSFERTLLHAHRCKFTQYLLFFLALKDPQRCCSSFSACLLSLLRDVRQPPITRSACAAYLASFLARCAPAPKELVVDVFFPFDPYLLRRSSRFLELPKTYICFSHGHPHVADDTAAIAADDGSSSEQEGSDDTTEDDEDDSDVLDDEQELLHRAGAMGASPSASPHPYGSSMGLSPAYGDALMRHRPGVGPSAGGASPLGTSPMPMSFTPYEGGNFMQQVPAQLNQAAAGDVRN
eukprot:gene3857-4114_t